MAILGRFGSSLLVRIGLALVAVGLLPLGFATWQLVMLNREAMTEQVLRSHIVAARTAADRAGSFLATREGLAAAASADPQLASGDLAVAGAAVGRALQTWAELGVIAVVLQDPNGTEILRATVSGADEPALAAALAAAGDDAPVVASGAGAGLLIVLSTPAAEVRATLRLVVSGAELVARLRPEEIGEQADLVLADRGGRVLGGSIGSLDGFPPDLVSAALSGRALGAQQDYRDAQNRRFLGAYAPVPGANWAVLSRQPTAVAEAVALRMRRRALLATGAAGALIVLLAAGAWASLIRPIRKLTEAHRKLAKVGPAGTPAGSDEISQLASAFEALEKSILDREALSKIFLGRYQVVDFLGGGGMGTVFRGWDPKLRRPVALKTVRLHRAIEASARQPLLDGLIREAVTVAQFNHPHIVAVHDVQDHPSGAFIAMEFVDGISLEALLRSEQRLELQRLLPLGLAIARALDAAHAGHVVHRDIKPANVLLGKNGDIKVTDFGIATFLRRADDSRGGGKEQAVGSPGYVPPESIQGKGFDSRGDLFALGSLLYRSVTGFPAFPGGDAKEILRSTLRGAVRPPRSIVPGLPIEFEALLLAMLERDPSRRPAEASEVIENLEHLNLRHSGRWEPPVVLAATA
jgi:serine/threonine-protein kinase